MPVFLSSFKMGAISGHLPDGNVSLIFRKLSEVLSCILFCVSDIVSYKNFSLPFDLSCCWEFSTCFGRRLLELPFLIRRVLRLN